MQDSMITIGKTLALPKGQILKLKRKALISFLIFANICQDNIKTMNSQFGEKIRPLREKQHLYLLKVAPLIEMDTAQLNKIEKGLRQLKREQIPIITDIVKASSDELIALWLADQIYAVVKDEKLANEAM